MSRIRVNGSESGQVLVLIIFMMVGLLGFASLAIDGGMLLAERRRAQNAADAGVMAAALEKIRSNNLFTRALQRIASNGYSNVAGPCTPAGYDCLLGSGEKWTVQVNNPPRWGNYAGNSTYIQVSITSEVDSAFAHLVFSGPLQTTVEAVSRIWYSEGLASGALLYAATEHDCKGLWFIGTGDTNVIGGNIFSNSDASAKNCVSGEQGGAGNVTVQVPHELQVVGSFEYGGSGSVKATIIEGVAHDILRRFDTPDCPGPKYYGSIKVKGGKVITLYPGNYDSIGINSPGSVVELMPGMYCILGDKGFTGSGGIVRVKGDPGGHGVMIYLHHGPFDLGGSTTVNLWAERTPKTITNTSGFDWKGMLVYADPANASLVKITGTSDSTYTGTIFTPNSECVIVGTGDSLAINSQVICYTVKIAGTASIDIVYDPDNAFILPPAIDLVQ